MANAGTDLDDDPDAGPGGPGDGDGRRRRDALCARLGHRFADPALLERALAHRSVSARNYERLEFLGDGLLNFAVAAELYRLRPDDDEGSLSRLRASLVRESTLAGIARELALGEHLRLGGGELASGGFERDSILADAIESIVGATFLDAGFEPARALVLRLLGARSGEPAERGVAEGPEDPPAGDPPGARPRATGLRRRRDPRQGPRAALHGALHAAVARAHAPRDVDEPAEGRAEGGGRDPRPPRRLPAAGARRLVARRRTGRVVPGAVEALPRKPRRVLAFAVFDPHHVPGPALSPASRPRVASSTVPECRVPERRHRPASLAGVGESTSP